MMGKSMKTAIASSSRSKPKSAASAKRASVACVSCKTRRTRCVKPEGQKVCNYCQRHSLECVMTEDERKRSTSKAYLDSLRNRIALLEDMLRKSGTEPPPMEQVTDKDNKTSDGASNSNTEQNQNQNENENENENQNENRTTTEHHHSPISTYQKHHFHGRSWCDRERESSPPDFKLGIAFLDAVELLHTAQQSPTQRSEEPDSCSAEWSIISASSGTASERLPSVPSLSSGDDETGYVPMGHVHSPTGDFHDIIGRKGRYGDTRADWRSSLQIESGEAWEGQAALLDMGFMLGLGAEEVFAVQKGIEGIGGLDVAQEYSFLLDEEDVEMEYKLA